MTSRRTLERARWKFVEFLVYGVRETIQATSIEEIEAEIDDLGLGKAYRQHKKPRGQEDSGGGTLSDSSFSDRS